MSAPRVPADSWHDPAGTRLVGDPVDVVSGVVTERTLCFRLIGTLFLALYRHYHSGHTTLARGLGNGQAHSYDHRLSFDADGLRLEEPIGRHIGFPALRADGDERTVQGATLRRLSLLHYQLWRPGNAALDFIFADPDGAARVARASHGNGEITFRYGNDSRLTGLTHSTGLKIVAEEDDARRLLSLAGPWDGGSEDRPILLCRYDDAGNLVEMIDALNRISRFAYDSDNRLIRRTDRRGYSFLFEYDAAGRCVRSAGEDRVMGVALNYRDAERITEVTRSDGGTWTYHYNEAGSITQVIGPYGDVRRYVVEDGRTVGEIDPLGNAVDYVLDDSGALTGKRFSSGRVMPVKAGQAIADPPPHRVADGAQQYLYGDLALHFPVAGPALAKLAPALRRSLLAEPAALTREMWVPAFGVLPWYPPPDGGREFSPFGHLAAQTLASGGRRQWTYDPNDSVHYSRDADGAVVRQDRRSWNQLAAWVDPLGNETCYRFTTEDLVTAVTDPGGTMTEFAYDKERRLLGVRRAGQLRETYRYDAAGNLVEKLDGNGETLLTLLPTADRLTAEKRLASGGTHRFSYNEAGRLLTAAVEFSEVQFAYDALGRRTLDMRDGTGVAHDFAAGPDLRLTAVLERFVIRYERSERGVTIRLPNRAWVRLDRPNAHSVLRQCSNGTAELCQYDAMGRLLASAITSERARDRQWTRRFRYSHEGDLPEVEDDRFGPAAYRFDAAHRLVSAHRAGRAEQYSHDEAGNLLAQPGLTNVALEPGNRLAAANGERFTYNVRHHISERRGPRGVVQYRYDARDMLVGVEGPDGLWQAEYDAIGRRVRAWQDTAERRFFWDTDRLAAEISPSGRLRIYVYADPLALTPLAFIDYASTDVDAVDGDVRFVFADQRGAPVLVDDAGGAVLWRAQLDPYGRAAIDASNGLELNLRFPGHYSDAATGLHYNRFRYYDPALGRYIQSDPLGIGGGINVYAYPANPLVQVDVRGLTGGSGGACPDEHDENAAEGNTDKEVTRPFNVVPPPPPDPALTEACGPAIKPYFVRPGEGRFPANGRYGMPGQPIELDPKVSRVYLYAVLEDGTIAYAPQYVDEDGNESVKHTDLTQGGKARVSGEIHYNEGQDEWAMDDQSGRYSVAPVNDQPNAPIEPNRTQDNLNSAAQLARNTGTQNDIVPHQREAPSW